MCSNLVLLPGMDGTGKLFGPLVEVLSPNIKPLIVSYPDDERLGYNELLPLVENALPRDEPFFILGESFSGPLALMAARNQSNNLKGVILCSSFIINPLRGIPKLAIRGAVRAYNLAPTRFRAKLLASLLFSGQLRKDSQEVLQSLKNEVLENRMNAVIEVDCRKDFQLCPAPLMVMKGTQDRWISKGQLAVMRRLRPTIIIEMLVGPHFLLQNSPTTAAEVIERFISNYYAFDVGV